MKHDKRPFILPLLIVAVGTGWLLSALGFAPDINWVWTIGLAAVGLLSFLIGGFDKLTVVIGPFFLLAAVLSVLRQTDQLAFNVEVPVLVIALGILMFIANLPAVPVPTWYIRPPDSDT